jgi:hypothetical protein
MTIFKSSGHLGHLPFFFYLFFKIRRSGLVLSESDGAVSRSDLVDDAYFY